MEDVGAEVVKEADIDEDLDTDDMQLVDCLADLISNAGEELLKSQIVVRKKQKNLLSWIEREPKMNLNLIQTFTYP